MPSKTHSTLDSGSSTPSSDDEILVRVEGVSKKFCRSLKKSLWYGVCDIASELNPFGRTAAFANSHKNLTTEDTESTTERLGRGEEEQTKFGPKGEGAGATESKGAAGGNQRADSGEFLEGHSQAGLQMDSEKPASIRSANDSRASGEQTGSDSSSAKISEICGRKNSDASAGLRAGEFWAVKDVSFELRRGECLGLIGHNGAGKTTLLKMLNGLIKPDAGSITMRGRVGALIALGAGFNPILTGRENIYINGSVLGLTKKELDAKIDEIIDFAEIREFIDMPVQSYSSGMSVRLGFAIATALDPDVLIVDEVLAVGDFQFRWKCLDRIKKLKQAGVSILLVSHNAADLIRTCDIGVLLNKGGVQFIGEINACLREYESLVQDSNRASKSCANSTASIERTHISLVGEDTSQGLLVRVEITAESRIEKCRIIASISHSMGGNLFNVSSCWNGDWITLEPGRNFVELQLGGFAFQTGTCSLEVNLRGEELKDVLDIGRAQLYIAETSPDFEGFGINGSLRPVCSWRVGRIDDATAVAA